jgi:hypothetical protein
LISIVGFVGVSAFVGGRLSVDRPSPRLDNAQRLDRPNSSPPVSVNASGARDRESEQKTPPWERRWSELETRAATPAREAALTALIEELAGRDPQGAISLAARETNLRFRAALLRAAVKGWGKADATSAAEWAESQTLMDRGQAIGAVLQGAIDDGDKATHLVAALIEKQPLRAIEYGNDLISALTESGQFSRASDFAATGTANCREDWILTAFSRWAEFQPEVAVDAASRIVDPALRDTAINAVIVGWAPTNPQGLIEFSHRKFSPEQQAPAVSSAVGFWADSDPVAAAAWITQNDPGAVADMGVASIALSSQLVRNPQTAANWATCILNPQLRTETLATVIEKWATLDSPAAETFAKSSPALSAEDRSVIVARLESHAAP